MDVDQQPPPNQASAAAMTVTTDTKTPRRRNSSRSSSTPKQKNLFYDTTQGLLKRLAEASQEDEQLHHVDHHETLAAGGPLTVSELEQLRLHCSNAASSTKLLTRDELYELQDLLSKHVQAALLVDLGADVVSSTPSDTAPSQLVAALEQWWTSRGQELVTTLQTGLQAAAVCLVAATLPAQDDEDSEEQALSVPVLHETALEACSTLLQCHTSRHVLSQSSVTKSGASSASPAKKAKTTETSNNNNKAIQQQWLKSQHHAQVLQQIVLPSQLLLLERWLQLVQQSSIRLDEAIVYRLISTALLAMEGGERPKTVVLLQQVQRASLDLLVALFHQYPSPTMRDSVVQDAVSMWLRTGGGNTAVRQYPIATPCHKRNGHASSHHQAAFLLTRPPSLLPASCVGGSQHRIQMSTALLVQLVQTAVVRPTFGAPENDQEEEGDSEEQPPASEPEQGSKLELVSGLQPCRAVSDLFVQYLFRRCARTKEDLHHPTNSTTGHNTTASDLRPRLTNLVDDLLSLLYIPTYPGAELVLASVMNRLHRDLMGHHDSNSVPLEPMYQTMAVEVLGKLCAVEARILAWQGEHALNMTTNKPSGRRLSDDEDGDVDMTNVHCLCGQSNGVKDTLGVSCENCHSVFHAACVGFHTKGSIPNHGWICDACRLAQIVDRQRSKWMETTSTEGQANDNTLSLLDETYALRQAVFSTLLTDQADQDGGVVVRFHVARWADELEQKAMSMAQQEPGATVLTGTNNKVLTKVLDNWDRPTKSGQALTEEGSIRAVISLASTTSALLLSFRNQVGFVLKLMSDESAPLMRKLSIKAIEKTMEGDPNLMVLPIVTKAVSRRLTDASISVREATVALVGSYVVQSPAIANTFHSALLKCLTDVGVSVRKRAVRIFEAILTSNANYKGRTAVCDIMLQCAADPKEEDGVRDLIFHLFEKLWLLDGDVVITSMAGKTKTPNPGASSHSTTPFEPGQDMIVGRTNPASVITPTPPPSNAISGTSLVHRKRAEIAAEQMMEVVKSSGSGTHLETLLKKLLGNESDTGGGRKLAERKKRRESSQKQCDQLVNSLLELLLSIEEESDQRGPRVGKELTATLQTIEVLAEVSPTSVFPHLDTILPYLKATNGVSLDDETSIVAAACEIICRLTPFFDSADMDRLAASSISMDLVQITYKFGGSALESAIRALSELVEHSEGTAFRGTLLKLAKTFYKYLLRHDEVEDFSSADEKIRSSTHRALRVLGLICQNNKTSVDSSLWGDELESSDDELIAGAELNQKNLILASYRVVSKYLVKLDNPTKCHALRALGGIFLSQPRLMLKLEQLGLIESVMSEKADVSLQLEALQCWRSILESEEKRIDGGHATAKLDADTNITVSERISGDQDGDATLFGGVLTGHAPRLFEMTHSPDRRVRFAVLDLLGLLLRQGLVNPNEAIAYLFALQGDVENNHIRSLALKLLMTEGDKRPNLLRQHICAGVKEAYTFQRAVYSTNASVSAVIVSGKDNNVQVECIFSTVFDKCASSSRKHRRGLFKNLLNLFDLNDSNPALLSPRRNSKSKKSSKKHAFPLLAFASQILAHLPYSVASDPLLIIHEISSMVTLQGAQVVDQFADLLRPVGLASDDNLDESNDAEDALERAARSKFPSRTQEARPMSSEDFDMGGFLNLCVDAAALILLLRLKSFLRKTYNLSETRCLEFDPNSKAVAEKAASKTEITTPFDASIPMAMHNKKAIDKDALIRQYAEFRRLMRTEHNFERSSSSEADDDETETMPAPRKRKASSSDSDN